MLYLYFRTWKDDGSSYVLFPYLKPGETVSKHSPYCGITGYRLFPKGTIHGSGHYRQQGLYCYCGQ